MKNLILLLTIAATTVSAQTPIDYSKGFCVRLGENLNIENAVIKIDNPRLYDGPFPSFGAEHKFFDFENGANALYMADWGGNLALVKPAGRFIQGKQLAMFTDYTHYGLQETLIVECRALGE